MNALAPKIRLVFATGILAVVSPASLAAMDLVDVVSKVENAVVRVDTDSGFGSGVVVDDRGVVLTNYHVVEGARLAKITLKSGKELHSSGYLAVDPTHDLALLQSDRLPQLSAIKIAGTLPKTGERVAAFGNPRGFSFTTSEGIVSAVRTGTELIEIISAEAYRHLGYAADATWIQTTAPISSGNSGGPLVNMNAELVGLNTWTHTKGQNLNFAIGLPDIVRVLNGKLDGAPQKFATLPKVRGKPGAPPAWRPGDGKDQPSDFTLKLPTGRVFSFDVFRVNSSEFNQAASGSDQGKVVIRHPNGSLYASAHQQNGQLNGVTIAQWENNQPMVYATYIKGKRHGVLKTWDEAGQPLLFSQFTQGHRHGFVCFFEEGEFRLLIQYKNDQPEWFQLMLGSKALDGFKSTAEAEKNEAMRELLEKIESLEEKLKSNEVTFRKYVTAFEKARKKELASQLAPDKRARMAARRQAVEAENAAVHNDLMRRFLGR